MRNSYYNTDPAKHAEQVALAMERNYKDAVSERRASERRRNTPGGQLLSAMYCGFWGIGTAPDLTVTHDEAVELARLSDEAMAQ
jgi:hypothetical protein